MKGNVGVLPPLYLGDQNLQVHGRGVVMKLSTIVATATTWVHCDPASAPQEQDAMHQQSVSVYRHGTSHFESLLCFKAPSLTFQITSEVYHAIQTRWPQTQQ